MSFNINEQGPPVEVSEDGVTTTAPHKALLILAFIAGLYLFLLSLDAFTASWRLMFSVDAANEVVVGNIGRMLENPLLGFFLGLLITSLIQSSSATMVLIMSYVATQNAPVSLCIPIILGANVGTTVTNTLVSLGHSFSSEEFRRVAPAALVDDIYKIFNVSVFFVLEASLGILTGISGATAEALNQFSGTGSDEALLPDFVGLLTEVPMAWWTAQAESVGSGLLPALVSAGAAFMVLFGGLNLMGKALTRLFADNIRNQLESGLGSPGKGAFFGCAICWVLQSSSVTTSLMMPLVANRIATLRQAYYFALGASVGTTIDSGQILAYLKYGAAGLVTGVVHVTVNVVGAAAFLSIPVLRELPISLAEILGNWLSASRWAPARFAILVAATFYGLPILLIWLI